MCIQHSCTNREKFLQNLWVRYIWLNCVYWAGIEMSFYFIFNSHFVALFRKVSTIFALFSCNVCLSHVFECGRGVYWWGQVCYCILATWFWWQNPWKRFKIFIYLFLFVFLLLFVLGFFFSFLLASWIER